MTAPGDATNVGSIVGYLTLNRVDWSAGVRDTERDAERLGRLSPDIHIGTNTGDVLGQLALVHAAEDRVGSSAAKAKPFVMNLYAALAALAPAALPIAAVAGGAIIGLLPTLAAGALGVKGITDEFKAGQLEGTAYGHDIQFLQNYLQGLKSTAASGLLAGLHTAVQQSRPDLALLRQDIGNAGAELGNIAGNLAPALLSVLHQLSPLFDTIGADLARGAGSFEHWVQSSDGIHKFVAYVQAELPHVEQFLGQLLTLISHLAQSGASFGGVMLTELTAFVRVLNAIPIGVLQAAIPLASTLYIALKAYQGLKVVFTGVNDAITAMGVQLGLVGPKAELAAAQQTAASLAVQAAAANEAAAVAAAKAEESAAAAEAAVAIGAAAEAQGSMLAAAAAATAEYAIEEAAAFQAAAVAAAESAAEIGASAEAAAAVVVGAGEEAAVGWSAMLGPIGLVIGAVALFGLTMHHSGQDAQDAKLAQDSYADSVKKSTDALSQANIAQTQDNLAKAGTYAQLQKLHDLNAATTLTVNDLTQAVNGSDDAYSRVMGQLQGVIDAGGPVSGIFTEQGRAALSAQGDLMKYRDALKAQIEQQRLLTQAQRAQQQATDGGAAATRASARALGVTRTAYLDAQVAAQKNTTQTKAQTLAFQLERNAAGLLDQALKTLAGQVLGVAEAQTASKQATNGVIQALKASKDSIHGNTDAILSAQGAVQQKVEADRALAHTIAEQTHSNDKAIASYKQSKQALEDDLRAHNQLTPAVQAYIDKLYSVKSIADYLNQHPVAPKVIAPNTGDVQSRLNGILTTMHQIGQGVTASVNIVTTGGAAGPGNHTVKADGQGSTGGPIGGHGAKGVDSLLWLVAPGEYLVNDQAVDRITRKYGPGAMDAINRGELPSAKLDRHALASPAPLVMPAGPARAGGAGSAASGATAAAQPALSPDAIRAALHGARLQIDPSLMHATIDTRAGAVARDYASFQDDLYGG